MSPFSSFNTSYVSVQVSVSIGVNLSFKGFNTSYVSVQDIANNACVSIQLVSIHHMCRFKKIYL